MNFGASAQPKHIQGRGGFMQLGHFGKYFVKYTRKKGLTGKNFVFFPWLIFTLHLEWKI